jgi:serine/threonine protein kinase
MCSHSNIIPLLDVFENIDKIYLVLQYVQGGDLFDYLQERDFKLSE